MIAAHRFEATYYRSISHETRIPQSLIINENRPNPLAGASSDGEANVFFNIESSVQKPCAADQKSLNGNNVKILEDEFAGFHGNVSTIGGNENNSLPTAIPTNAACDPISTISEAGQFAVTVIAKSIREAFAPLALFFGPDANQAARIVFSWVGLISAAARTVFPLVREALLSIRDPKIQAVVTLISFILATGHLLISTVATLIATNNLPTLFPKAGEDANSKSNIEKIKEAIDYFFDEIEEKLVALNEKGLIGWLGVVREWLMTSSAVVGFLAVLPFVVKTVGTIISAPIAAIVGGSINLVAGIVELSQGIKEYRVLKTELSDLEKLQKEEVELSALGEASEQEKAMDEKRLAITASEIRIGKGVISILTSVASIVLGALAIAASISVPVLPAVITAISLSSVVIYAAVTIALREIKKWDAVAQQSDTKSVPALTDSPGNDIGGSTGSLADSPAELPDVQPGNTSINTDPVSLLASPYSWRR